jgi:nucleotide-binding universal stress UspA family protein
MFTSILVPFDESSLSRKVLPYVEYLARIGHARVSLLQVVSDRALTRYVHPNDDTVLAADEVVARLRQAGIEAAFTEARGKPATAIVQGATDVGADLIAMSTHGRGELARVIHGSVAEEVLRASRIPVLLATPACARRWADGRPLRILVPLDGSPLAEQALAPALRLSQNLDVELRLVRVVHEQWELDALGFGHLVPVSPRDRDEASRYLEQIAAPLRQGGRSVMVYVEDGDPAGWIARLVDYEAIDLVAMATHGRGSLTNLVLEGIAAAATGGRLHLTMGSVAAAVVEQVSAPVLLVRPVELAPPRPAVTADQVVTGRPHPS